MKHANSAAPANKSQSPIIWAIGGGKGGIGKSFISSSLAICLARLGKPVTLIDLDLGAANLHTCFGLTSPQKTLSDFISGRAASLEEIVEPTEVSGVKLISGFNDALNVANFSTEAKNRMIAAIRSVSSPYVILDLGAGTSDHTLDFFLSAHLQIVAVTPEPTAVENAYRFMKSSFYRKLRSIEADLGIHEIIESAMDSRNSRGIRSPADLFRYVNAKHPGAGAMLVQSISDFRIQLLLNQVRTRQDVELAHSMRSVCKKYFGIEIGSAGYIDYDNAVWQSLRKKRPPVIEFPYSTIIGQFLNISKSLLAAHSNPNPLKAVV